MTSRADTHDLDKLHRWQKDLEAVSPDAPPVYAIFLVSERDTMAHDVFRSFRTSFEEHGLGFAHLVIFGQHGVSGTARRLLDKFGAGRRCPSRVGAVYRGRSTGSRNCSSACWRGIWEKHDTAAGWTAALDNAVGTVGDNAEYKEAVTTTLREICAELTGLA